MLPYGKRKRLDDDEQPALISSSSSSTASSQKRSRGEVADPSALDDDEYAHETADNLIFEDPYADDMDDSGEEVVQDEEDDDDDDEDDEDDPHHAMDGEADVDDDDAEQLADHEVDDETDEPPRVWRPGIDQLQEGEVLDYDSTAYDMFHTLQVEWPCLSFGIVRDKLGFHRTKYPHTAYLVAGTQADSPTNNFIYVMKVTDLHRTKHDDPDNSDDDSDDDDDLDDDPIVEARQIKHHGGVNRLKLMPQRSNIVAAWSDARGVQIWDVSKHLAALDTPGMIPSGGTVQRFTGHTQEGFALDWSSVVEGNLLSGDNAGRIHYWTSGAAEWSIDQTPFVGHTSSVEDLQWSPSEATVFASCSADQYIRIWDTRKKDGSALHLHAHESDVNVLSWNTKVGYLMVSGSDDGSFSIWDLRTFSRPVAHFNWHKGPITSVEWNPHEESVLAVSSADNQITLWDLALEKDAEDQSMKVAENFEVPPQLLFIHQGQSDIKELHWHPQIPGAIVSTAASGFNIFKTINS